MIWSAFVFRVLDLQIEIAWPPCNQDQHGEVRMDGSRRRCLNAGSPLVVPKRRTVPAPPATMNNQDISESLGPHLGTLKLGIRCRRFKGFGRTSS
jgi:hypothetical protein